MSYSMYLGMMLETPSRARDDIIMHLIDKGCNVNVPNDQGQTPLHKAVCRSSIYIAKKLIKNGANINVQDENGYTPLHEAVHCNNVESICMLLYYEADVNILNGKGFTPFVQGLDTCMCAYNLEMASWLLNYYDKFPGRFALMSSYQNLFRYPIEEDKMLLVIRQIWTKFDHCIMLRDKSMFLSLYLLESLFSIPKWLNCLYSMLNTPDAAELMTYKFDILDVYFVSHFSDVFCSLLTRNVRRKDRVVVIALWLSFGAQIYTDDVTKAFVHFGMNEEVMLLIYSTPVPLLTLIFALEEHFGGFQSTLIYQFICGVRRAGTSKLAMRLICKSLEFFTWDRLTRMMIIGQVEGTENDVKILEILEKLPKLPSLVELCRNLIVRIIRKNVVQSPKKLLNPLRYHAAVKRLDVTQHVKDILHFKKPLYI